MKECPCGKNGRFRLYRGNDMKLCLKCMQFWLFAKLVLRIKDEDKILAYLYSGFTRQKIQNSHEVKKA